MPLPNDFTENQLRELANLRQYYLVWRNTKIERIDLNFRLSWERRGEKEYLYKRSGKTGDGTSLGARSAETEEMYRLHMEAKDSAQQRLIGTSAVLDESARICAALGLGLFPNQAAKILRAADLDGVLGTRYMVVGTNTMLPYELEAGHRFAFGLEATKDFDLAFTGGVTTFAVNHAKEKSTTLFEILKQIDATYTKNTERGFQAVNRHGFEVELLAAPSVIDSLAPNEVLTPLPSLPEQEWLLLGKPIFHVVCAVDKSPVPIVVPDPRWMGLHKLWLSQKPERTKLKVAKDARQGLLLLTAVRDFMPHYPMDSEFENELPKELRPHYDHWRRTAPPTEVLPGWANE
ncbi:MAG: GSU2403 family nucleotidyltransferase fold protein [Betaproteobacteria bacterium]